MDDIVYALDALPPPPTSVVYLAGPVSRDRSDLGWHPEAVHELRAAGHRGPIVVPRPRPDHIPETPTKSPTQTQWEHLAMVRADALLFWIPRVLWTLPGLTTNLEWGIWYDSGKAVLGAPPGAPRMRYLEYYAQVAGAPQAKTLHDAARIALDLAAGRAVSPGMRVGPAR